MSGRHPKRLELQHISLFDCLFSQCLFSLLINSLLCSHIVCIEESENLFELRDIVLSESPLRVFVVEEDQQLKLQ